MTPPAGSAVFGGSNVRDDVEFFEGVWVGEENDCVHQRLVVVDAVEDKVVRLRRKSVHDEGGTAPDSE